MQSTLDIPGVDSDLHSNECSLGKNSGQTHQDRPFLPASSGTVRRDHPRASLHMLDDARESQHHLQLENHREGRDQGKQGGSKNIDQRRSGNKHVAPPERVQSARFAIPI